MILVYILVIISFFSGMWVVISKREHLLSVLLSFEFISLMIYFLFLVMFLSHDLFYSLIYVTFTACEGALGLSILVMMSRTHGGDYFKSFNVLP